MGREGIKKASLYKAVINYQPGHILYKVVFMLLYRRKVYEN